uniref:DUF218 domain-containing protein n=1 Tax=Rhodosorus marinus TaxID=101924 RepID=A0A6T6M5C9_9RHOD|mmetsp:Transcript_22170/g.32093  ORF Transcript_22170/g.32093 Transcript_22170/m.32093 type:complete len:296 (+) Transcript_22170:353-1240(+)
MAASASFLRQKRFLIVAVLYVAGIVSLGLQGVGDFHDADVNTAGRTLPIYQPPTLPGFGMESLVMVAGHAIYVSGVWTKESVYDESNWFLEKDQAGQVSTFIEHIKTGVEAAAADSMSLLIFSGGETRKGAGPRSEAQTYWLVADALDWFGYPQVSSRAFTEEHARDSFENLSFSMCRFRELTGGYPSNTTIVSFKFKKRRFLDMHAEALLLPKSSVHYVGVDPPIMDEARSGELSNAVVLFEEDPNGCQHKILTRKRAKRNPFARTIPYPAGCPEMSGVLLHCGDGKFHGHVPW